LSGVKKNQIVDDAEVMKTNICSDSVLDLRLRGNDASVADASQTSLNLAPLGTAPSGVIPKALAVVGDQLAIAWSDGVEQDLSLQTLREACPCALCEGEPDVMGQTLSTLSSAKKNFTPESFVLKKYEFVGGYGIQFFWGDGHSSGIYSFQYLRKKWKMK